MKKHLFLSSILFCFLVSISVFGQMQGPSPKLKKEKGFLSLKIGSGYSSVKSILQKDSLSKRDSWEPNDSTILNQTTALYLVDLSKKGYSEFFDQEISRIEVFFSSKFSKQNKPEVIYIKIYFEKGSLKQCGDMFIAMEKEYGISYRTFNQPRELDDSYLWYAPNLVMEGHTFYGDHKAPKEDYFILEFYNPKCRP